MSKLQPVIPASQSLPEITIKVVMLGIILVLMLAASNIYLALKLGTTIAASIPASVIALGVLRFFKQSNVLESNIVQTCASAGEGVAAAMAFVLPAMLMLGVWQDFNYWQTVAITVLGGVLGVLFSVPLRRMMLNMPTLRFPEGTAVGNLLRASVSGAQQLKLLVQGCGVGGGIAFMQTGFKVLSDNIQTWFRTSHFIFGMGWGLAPAALAAGYIVGIEVAVSFLLGLIVAYVFLVPWISHHYSILQGASTYMMVQTIWSTKLRFVGVGVMLVGGIWTLFRLLNPLLEGIRGSGKALNQNTVFTKHNLRTERDIPFKYLVIFTIVTSVLLFIYMHYFFRGAQLPTLRFAGFPVSVFALLYILIIGFLLSVLCGYFAGLIGSSNNPLSGLLLMSVILLGVMCLGVFHVHNPAEALKVISFIVLITAVVAGTAVIANENLQDLKAGQIVGATPWKQQVILILGVVVSALIVAPVLNLLFHAYGMGGIYPRPGMDPSQMLAAPQAGLIESVAKGLITGSLHWTMILIGVGCGVFFIIADEILRFYKFRLPCLAVGLAIYLPPSIITSFIYGGIVNFFVHRRQRKLRNEDAYNNSVLLACGLVAGNALMGVLLAIPFVIFSSSDVLAIMPHSWKILADILGVLVFVGLIRWLYRVGTQQ